METFVIPVQSANQHRNKWIAIYFSITDDQNQLIQLRRKVKLIEINEKENFIRFFDGNNSSFQWPLNYLDKMSLIK